MTLEDLGYNLFFEEKRKELGLSCFSVARVITEHKGAYHVKNSEGEYWATITGKHIFRASSRIDYPVVGDWVAIEVIDHSDKSASTTTRTLNRAIIRGILPRATTIKRTYKGAEQPIATNIDTAFIIQSVDRDYSLNRFERYCAIAQDGGVQPIIVLNKIDLLPEKDLQEKLSELTKRFPAIDVILTSTLSDRGLDELRARITTGKTYCFLGSSGVGKSTLINKLLKNDTIKTEDISSYSGRGKHITTSRHMYVLSEDGSTVTRGMVIDNPGMREVGIGNARAGVDSFFDHITAEAHECRYVDCTHTHEPGCAVVAAVTAGTLDQKQYANYITLKKEAAHYDMNDFEKREKNKQFGKFIKKAKKDLKKFRSKY